jgi:hypothetical protein
MGMILLQVRPGTSSASDVVSLSKKLAAAFIADQVIFMCTLEIVSFAQETAGRRGTTRYYLEHLSAEVLSGVPPFEARRVVKGAVEITRETGRKQARTFSPNYPDVPAGALRHWCDNEGRVILREFMTNHDRNHERFLRELAKHQRPAT